MKQDPSTRNTIIFFVCAMVVLFAYDPTTRDWAKARASTDPRVRLRLLRTPADTVEAYCP